MRDQVKTVILLGLGLIFLGAALATNQFQIVLEYIIEFCKSSAAGVPPP
ncbi:MAG: hypothetical protein ACFFDI_02525 [Promethearchaeota archaeon]